MTGCLLTADGTRDDRIHLLPSVALGPLPEVKNTSASAVDDEDEDEDEDESASSGGIGLGLGKEKRESKSEKKIEPESSGTNKIKVVQEDVDNVKHDDDELELDDEDDPDDQLHEVSLRDALPDGWKVVESDAVPDTLDGSLVGLSFVRRWTAAGWCIAKITKYYRRPKTQLMFNYEVRYTGNELREHRLRMEEYSTSDDAAYGSWCLIRAPSSSSSS